jgi:hypothetical protein
MSGVTLNSIGATEFNVGRLIASIFPDYWEFSAFFFVYFSSLFASSFFLYREILLRFLKKVELDISDYTLVGFSSLFIVLLPHSTVILGSLIGLNLFVLATFKLFSKMKKVRLIWLFVLSGLFGNFTLGGYFYIPACIVLALLFSIKRKNSLQIFLWLCIGTLIVIACEYRLFAYILLPLEESHRANWLDGRKYNWSSILSPEKWNNSIMLGLGVIDGKTPHFHYQWNTNHVVTNIVSITIAVYSVIKIYEIMLRKTLKVQCSKVEITLKVQCSKVEIQLIKLFSLTLVSVGIVLLGYGVLRSGVFNLSVLLNQPFQFERVIVSLPMLSGLLMLSAFMLLKNKIDFPAKNLIVKVVAIISVFFLAYNIHEPLIRKSANIKHHKLAGKDNPFIPKYTIGSRYNKGGYDAIKSHLGEKWVDERVISVSLDPMATAYNGFSTADGYFPNYPERYQQEFLKVISPAFEDLGPKKSNRYVGWGNRMRVPIISKTADKKVVIKVDGCAFEAIGGTLVISSSEIFDPAFSKLRLEKKVQGVNRGLKSIFWLYRVNSTQCNI